MEEKPTGEKREKNGRRSWKKALDRADKSRAKETEVWEIASRVRNEIVCLSCSRASSAGYRFLFPLRLVLEVCCFAAEVLRTRERMSVQIERI